MPTKEEVTALVREAAPDGFGEFRPCAFFDERLDCIRVMTKDCSVREDRVNDWLTILIKNHSGASRKECVGFTLKGACHLFSKYGWEASEVISMSDLLDAVLRSFPETAVQVFIDYVAKPLVEEEQIEQVDLDPRGLPAAIYKAGGDP